MSVDKTSKPKFSQLNGSQKTVYLGKLVLFLVTFGFAFSSLLD